MKKQFKKSLSLFLAVLMVLSCWVWVAPQKAEAVPINESTVSAEAKAGKYHVRVYANVTDTADDGMASHTWKVNGTNLQVDQYNLESNGYFQIANGWVSSFPTSWECYGDPNDHWLNNYAARLQNVVLQVYNNTTGGWDTVTGETEFNFEEGGNSHTFGVDATKNPTVKYIGTTQDLSVIIPTLETNNVAKTATVTAYIYDQYGVRLSGQVPDSYRLAFDDGQTTCTKDEYGAWVEYNAGSATVYVNEYAQVNIIGNKDSKTKVISLYATKAGVADEEKICDITLNYPEYLTTVNADGSISGLGSKIFLSDGTTTTQTWAATAIYGADVSPVPDGTAYKDGYVFKGYWTKPQPTNGDADYNNTEDKFAEPISTEEFIGKGGTKDGTYVEVEVGGTTKKFYNAGEKWDPDITTVIGQKTYYGWWLSRDLSVKFYDIDGKYIKSVGVKAGMTQADIEWPDSAYKDTGYNSGAFKYTVTDGVWVGSDGEVVNESGYEFTHDLLLTPQLSTNNVKDRYTINFINPLTGQTLAESSQNITYREDISNKIPAAQEVPVTIRSELQYSYSFVGWSKVVPSADKNYHILVEEGNFDTDGRAIGINSDWIIRADATFYPVFRRSVRTYAVNFTYTNAAGIRTTRKVSVKYGDRLVAPMEYVPYSYATGGFEYPLTGWKYTNGKNQSAEIPYSGVIIFTSENIRMTMGAVDDGDNVTPVAIQATYGDGVATPYTVTFKYRGADGKELASYYQVKHGENITQEMIDSVVPAKNYDNGEALVTYMNSWKVLEGAASAEKYDTNRLTTFSPTSHVVFEAEYGNPKYFYTVTYVDGSETKSYRILEGENIKEWTEKVANENENPDVAGDEYKDVPHVPSMKSDEKGEYIFQGWFDAKQADTTYNTTNGTKYTTANKVSGNLTLYPQFKYTPFTYTIKFMNFDGSVQLAAGKYEYGQNFSDIFYRAQKAAQSRAADETYTYQFIGWDQPYNEERLVCEGKDVTYTALYKASYRYYDAKWYNSKLVDGKWVADKETEVVDEQTVEKYLLATTHHTYNSKVNTPSVKAVCKEAAPAGQEYVFAGWYYNDANGNAVKYTRGMLITSGMEFYATYTLTAEKHTVTTVVAGEDNKEYEVASGEKVSIPDPLAGYVDTSKHKGFDGWYTDSAYTTKFDIETQPVTSDLTLYAKFTESAHVYDNMLDIKAPTYYAKGERKVWCSCNPDRAYMTSEIDMLTDNVAPTGTIYLGSLGKWSSTGEPAYNTDGKPVTLYANEKTDVIINTNDTGKCADTSDAHNAATCVNCLYNPNGIGKGIKAIKAFAYPGNVALTADNYGAAMEVAVNVYEDNSQAPTNTANYTIKLGEVKVADLVAKTDTQGNIVYDANGNPVYEAQYDAEGNVISKPLQNGETYIIYYYAIDKAGNMLNKKVRTAKFIYDIADPSVTVAGEGDDESVYCEEATVTVYEADTALKVDGNAVTLTEKEVDGETVYTYTITYNENLINRDITAIDRAGNTTTKKIKVDKHDYATKQADVTCTADGYEKTECLVCGDIKSESTVAAKGHAFEPVNVMPATCLENGSVTVKCKNCEIEITTEYEVDENGEFILEDGKKVLAYPAYGHEYAKDSEGNVIYTVVTAPTCMTVGKEVATCTYCGEGEMTRVVPTDSTAHKLGTLKTLQATCTSAGKTYRVCKLCTVSVDVSVIPAKAHGTIEAGTAQWVVTKEATCKEAGTETLQCSICTGYIDGEDEDALADTREIAKTEDHNYVYVETVTENGVDYAVYKCRVCDKEKKEEVKAEEVVKHIVTFIDEEGNTLSTVEKIAGETLAVGTVTAPAKTDATGKNTYTFAAWAEATLKDGEWVAGEKVAASLTVAKDVTLMPTYTSVKNIWTHQFITYNAYTQVVNTIAEGEEAEAEWDYTDASVFETMMNVIGGKAVPSKTPAIKETDLFKFEFMHWEDENGKKVEDFTVTYNEATKKADRTFYAVFNAIPKEYKVTYLANGVDYVWHTTVKGGESVTFGGTTPTKAPEANYHYTFSKWYLDATLTTEYANQPITADTTLYAGFTSTAHNFTSKVTQESTCVLPEIKTYTCACGYSYDVTGKANGHTDGEVKVEGQYNIVYCAVCKEEIRREATVVKVIFDYNNNATTSLVREYNVGERITYTGIAPTKAADAYNTYTFLGWYLSTDASKAIVDFENTEVMASADATYVAEYEAKTRYYDVTYVDADRNTLKNHSLKYGEKVPAYEGTAPAKKHDANNHYVFAGWSVEAGETVTGSVMIKPVFTSVAHTYTTSTSNPSCESAGGITKTCTCGYFYVDPTNSVPALGHDWKVDTIPATYEKDGLETKTCNRCGETKETVLPKLEYRSVVITVKNSKGGIVEGAKVELWKDGVIVGTGFADPNGKVTFSVADGGKYSVVVSGVEDAKEITYDINVGDKGFDDNGEPSKTVTVIDCYCSCHRSGFWGTIFRLFHNIIKLFTGGIKCCACPDSRY